MIYQNENFNGQLDFRSRFHKGYRMEAHLHEYSELIWCTSGDGYVTVGSTEIFLQARQLVWIPPNTVHRYVFQEAEVVCAVFSNDLIPLYQQNAAGRRLHPTPIDLPQMAEILDRFHCLSKHDVMRISGYLNLICAEVTKHAEWESSALEENLLYQRIISYLTAHHTDSRLSLQQLAKHFGYNEKYLSHTLHELTGIHFCKLLAYYRVNTAKEQLLAHRKKSISAIAFDSGFSALNTFHRSFRELTGVSPAEYRKGTGTSDPVGHHTKKHL